MSFSTLARWGALGAVLAGLAWMAALVVTLVGDAALVHDQAAFSGMDRCS